MEEPKTDKREHILNVAEKVFGELGYEGASTRHLAGEAGINTAMLNYYFGSKDGLLKAIIERRIGGTRQALLDIKEQPITAWEKLTQAIDIYLNKLTTNNHFHRLVHREISLQQRSEMSDFISESVFNNLAIFRAIIAEGVQKEEFKLIDIEMTVASIFGTFYYIVNSRQVTASMLQQDLQDPEVLEKIIKPRIKKFLHDYLRAFLFIK